MAWQLFRPHLLRELGAGEDIENRNAKAAQVLDKIMADSWVVAYRRLGFYDVSIKPFIAFHPVRDPSKVLRLHPLVCGLMDSDFDGDKGAVFLPLSVEAQAEAGERLTQK
jgi:DNA-directed RNA polymerase subunit beta'